MKTWWAVAAVLVLPLGLSGCTSSHAVSPLATVTVTETQEAAPETPTPVPTPTGPLAIKVTGACTSKGGTLYADGHGFTPNGVYRSEVKYPNGSAYPIPNPEGQASGSGTTPHWQWPCFYQGVGDPAGTYSLTITDETTGRTAHTTFKIDKP